MSAIAAKMTAETEADYDRWGEYFEANDELRRRTRALEHATDATYEGLWDSWKYQSNLVAEIRATLPAVNPHA